MKKNKNKKRTFGGGIDQRTIKMINLKRIQKTQREKKEIHNGYIETQNKKGRIEWHLDSIWNDDKKLKKSNEWRQIHHRLNATEI